MAEKYLYPEGSTGLSAMIPTEMKDALRAEAKASNRSMSQVVTAIFREHFTKEPVGV